jgi:phosphohistidine phosphatase
MKELILIRHAKSDWGNEDLKDIDRHLNERGYTDAYAMSAWFAESQKKPDLLLCSSATRTLSTAMIFVRAMDLDVKKFKVEPRIYEAHRDELKKLLAEQDDTLSTIMLVGHNPAITELCNALSENMYFDNLPTCAIVKISGKSKTWKEFAEGRWQLASHRFPKDYHN